MKSLTTALTRHVALMAGKYDAYVRAFICLNSDGPVVSLGSGFDTRYRRIPGQPRRNVEIDLPGLASTKKTIRGGNIPYLMIGSDDPCQVFFTQDPDSVITPAVY